MPGPAVRSWQSLRVHVAVGLLVSLALLSGLRFLVQIAALARGAGGPDEVSLYDQRFAPVRRALPRLGTVGYLSDRPDADREFFMTQYALAPVVVVADTRAPLVVGNFFDPDLALGLAAERRLALLQDFGAGVALYLGPGG